MPYVPDLMYMKALKEYNVDINSIDTFFSHGEFEGSKLNNLLKKELDVWPIDAPLNITGHIHMFEIIQPNLIVAGTPTQLDFIDKSKKGVLLLDFIDKPKINFLELNLNKMVVLTVHYTQLESLILENDITYCLEIYGPTYYVKQLMDRPDIYNKFKGIKRKFFEEEKNKVKITKDDLININKDLITDDSRFYNDLSKIISSDQRMYNVYLSLFNK